MIVERFSYRGWQNAYKLSNGAVELIVTADIGPRILFYGFCGGENLLHEVEDEAGKIGGSEFRLYGGHRLWVSPEVERTYYPDNARVSVSEHINAVRFTAPREDMPPGTKLQKELEMELGEVGSEVRITHRIRNQDAQSTRLAAWSPTMMRAGGRAILPLSPRTAMDKDHYLSIGVLGIWSYTDFADPRWRLGTSYIQLQQFANPAGRFKEQMAGIYNSSGWGAYFTRGYLFIKRAAVITGAQYPDFGCNFELFTNPEFLELETLGPMVELRPGEVVEHVERWWLFDDLPSGENDVWIDTQVLPLVKQTLNRD
ncbi:MAG: hypothetical protein DMG92_13165 [Acidobacteria bacterium]|nr:MAG: hypothetical protein DMG92_13165 [Acidobacteriota bacterium]